MKISLGYGKKILNLDINNKNLIKILKPNDVEIKSTGESEIKRAMLQPIHSQRLKNIVRRGEKVAIITSDITRPMPSKIVIPVVLEELYEAGIQDKDIKIVFALGSHRKHTEAEKKYLVGEEIYKRIECLDLDVDDCINLGTTSSGTPVNIFRTVAEADRRICLGNIEYHYFAGYSGGAKAIMPGVATKESIQANHSMMVKKEARTGEVINNPVRSDIDEVAQYISIDFIVNVVLDEKKDIIKATAGNYIDAHREGCKFLDRLYKITIEKPADIVIVSLGGYPKDINLYQAQKGLDNAKYAVKDGGIIILTASCVEGLGACTFEQWMTSSMTPEEMIDRIQEKFELGGHKAAAIAMVLKKAQIFLISELEDDLVRGMNFKSYNSLNTALKDALQEKGKDAEVIVMPYGGSTLPVVKV